MNETMVTRLDVLRASRREDAGWEASYQEILSTLNREGFLSQVLRAGEVFPDFMLPSAEGRLVGLRESLALGPVVLGFFRGAWCPFCKIVLEALAENLPGIEAAGARMFALTPETGGLAMALKTRHQARFEVLADVDFGVGLAAGVVFRIPPLYQARVEAAGLDFPQRHGNGAWCLPVPAIFVIAPDGRIAARFMDVDFSRRASEIIAAIGRV
ncbi:MAG: peroxiredoxin-like family protein [Acidocella sp.]|nr:peroxiredoxin-like family protein [Acidocella sp.]